MTHHIPPRITRRTWLSAAAVFGIALFVAFILPSFSGCRPGWHHWEDPGGAPPYFFCGEPPPSDDWGYTPHSLLPLKIAVGVGGLLLAVGVAQISLQHHIRGGTAAALAVVVVTIGAVVPRWNPSLPEQTGQIASTLRCLDPGCEGLTVEQAVMRDRPGRERYVQARRAWLTVWTGLRIDDASLDAIRSRLVEKFGEDILR